MHSNTSGDTFLLNPNPSRIYQTSPAAIRDHKRNSQISLVTYTLLAVIGVLGLWTILKITGVFGETVPDLADIASIRDHIVTRLVTALTVATVVIYLFKEWRYGDFSFSMVYFLVPVLALWLFPVVAAELEPDVAQFDVEFQLTRCEPGSFEGNQINGDNCTIVPPDEITVLMSNANPTREDAIIREPGSLFNDYARWNVEGRGEFFVYFMLQQDSMAECQGSLMASGRDTSAPYSWDCIEYEGNVWSVHKFQTSEHQTGRLVVVQQLP